MVFSLRCDGSRRTNLRPHDGLATYLTTSIWDIWDQESSHYSIETEGFPGYADNDLISSK